MKRICLLLAVCLAFPSLASAGTKTWTGAVDGNWSNAGNWAEASAPAAGDDLFFGNVATTFVKNDFAPGMVFHSLAFFGSSNYIVNGSSFVVTGGISGGANNGATFLAPIVLGATQTFSGVIATSGVSSLGLGSYTLTMSGQNVGHQAVISGSGGIVVSGSVNLYATNTYTGPTSVTPTGQLTCYSCTIPGPVALSGQFFFSQISPPNVAHTGALTSTGGTLHLRDVGGATGSLTLDAASHFDVQSQSQGAFTPLAVNGTVALGNAQLSFAPSYVPATGSVFTILSNDGSDPINGTFAGLPEGARLTPTQQISYHGGDGNDVTITIIPPQAATSTTVQASPNPVLDGRRTTLRATVTSAAGTPSGNVEFFIDEIFYGTVPLSGGTATLQVGPLALGTHSVRAVFSSDNATMQGSVAPLLSLTVQAETVIRTATALEVSSSTSVAGQPVTLTATVTAEQLPLGSIVFSDGDVLLDTQPLAGGSVSITLTKLAAGTHAFRAVFVPVSTVFGGSVSDVVTHTVTEGTIRHRPSGH